ncbi:MAG: response regulator [Anaerolineaceae bacterium]|nr:response regulator [Anaerolineaceae bacterium]
MAETKTIILIVEDDLDLSEMLSAYFKVQDYEVLTAAWGKEALELVQHHNVALVMLDIRLPDIDGYEVCRQMRLQRRTQNVPIIFLTEKRDRIDKLQGLELGVVDYITKPFDVQELRLRARNAISRAGRQTSSNPVTELPESEQADQRLNELLITDDAWAILLIAIKGMSEFRESYGFVAADDVLRAITMMIKNAVREMGGQDDFVGHLAPEDFMVITSPEKVSTLRSRITTRINQSSEYFYPLRDRETTHHKPDVEYISLKSGVLQSASGEYADLDALKAALLASTEAT